MFMVTCSCNILEGDGQMKLISDIRLFYTNIPNTDGNPLPLSISDKSFVLFARRVAMKLRENKVELDGFDHLYINFTTCPVQGGIALSNRAFQTWYRFFDYHVDETLKNALFNEKNVEILSQCILQVLNNVIGENSIFEEAIKDALKGERMYIKLKEKECKAYKSKVCISLLDDGKYQPLLYIIEKKTGNVIKEIKMKRGEDLGSFGELLLNDKRLMIKPRKSEQYKKRKPIIISFNNIE